MPMSWRTSRHCAAHGSHAVADIVIGAEMIAARRSRSRRPHSFHPTWTHDVAPDQSKVQRRMDLFTTRVISLTAGGADLYSPLPRPHRILSTPCASRAAGICGPRIILDHRKPVKRAGSTSDRGRDTARHAEGAALATTKEAVCLDDDEPSSATISSPLSRSATRRRHALTLHPCCCDGRIPRRRSSVCTIPK